MDGPHRLLARQLKRHQAELAELPENWLGFFGAVDSAYREADLDRGMLERALELSSQELLESNTLLQVAHGQLELRVKERTEALSRANTELRKEIEGRKRFEKQLVHIANHDSLTDLLNRRQFELEIDKHLLVAESESAEGAVLFLDLDQFKDVNDTLGHRAGDNLLISVAELLRGLTREGDVLARPGGDEFAILLPATKAVAARHVAQRIEEAIRNHTFLLGRRPLNVTASIGIALFPRHGSTSEEVLANADLAMYQAKANGRSRAEMFRTDRNWKSVGEERLQWRNRIMEALREDKFLLYAQTIRSLKGFATFDYELLLRLPSENGGLAPPRVFLGVAEDFGLIQEIDRWVMQQAIRTIAEQERVGASVRLAVNISAKSLGDADLTALIRSQLASSSIDPGNLVVEVTETAAIANLGRAQSFIRALKSLGCQFSLDDFGAGFSSFYHLKHLPVDYLKIDGSFIKGLLRSEVDQELVKAIVAVAHGLRKQTVAEFVGDQGTLRLLREYGVDYAQGFYVGHPREVHGLLLEDGLRRAA